MRVVPSSAGCVIPLSRRAAPVDLDRIWGRRVRTVSTRRLGAEDVKVNNKVNYKVPDWIIMAVSILLVAATLAFAYAIFF